MKIDRIWMLEKAMRDLPALLKAARDPVDYAAQDLEGYRAMVISVGDHCDAGGTFDASVAIDPETSHLVADAVHRVVADELRKLKAAAGRGQ